MRLKSSQAGDTIIEVILAFTVFSMIAVGAIAIMNRGTATAEQALETTLVRQQIDNQAAILRYLHQSYMADPTNSGGAPAVFKTLIDDSMPNGYLSNDKPSSFGDNLCLTKIPGVNPFALQANGTLVPKANLLPMSNAAAPAFSQQSGANAYGLWIEAVKGEGAAGQPSFADFHIRACWYSTTDDVARTLGTIVRLYYVIPN